MPRSDDLAPPTGVDADRGHFAPALLYAAAKLYYLQDATQAEVASKIGTSRATVSRLLAEARKRGIVRIEVIAPQGADLDELGDRLTAALGLDRVYLSGPVPPPTPTRSAEDMMGAALAPAVGSALEDLGLQPGDILLVSSGRTMYEVAQSDLPALPGVVVAPTVGGNDQPEGWYQTNEITRLMAARISGRAVYLFAPALPGPELYQTVRNDPAIQRVLHLWPQADAVLMGIGAPPALRSEMPDFVPKIDPSVREAVGDLCSQFFDRDGVTVAWEGSERLIALELDDLAAIPARIAVAVGQTKITPIVVAARAGYYNQLVTDPATAEAVLAQLDSA